MREIDLKNYEIHTDLVRDSIINKVKSVDEDIYEKYSIKVSHIRVNEKLAKILEKKEGDYTTIYFEDITDNTNYKHLKEILTSELKRMLEKEGVTKEKSVLIDIKRRIRQDSPFRCRHPLEQMSMFNFNLLQIYEKKSKSG